MTAVYWLSWEWGEYGDTYLGVGQKRGCMPRDEGTTDGDESEDKQNTREATAIRLDGRGRATFEQQFRDEMPSKRYILYLNEDGTITGHPA